MMYFLDTSAVLNGALREYPFCYISPIVISELEKIKTSFNKDEHVKYLARQAVNTILSSNQTSWSLVSHKKIDKLLKKYDFLQDIPDHRLICEALVVAAEIDSNTVFVTGDGAQALFVKELPQLQLKFFVTKEEITPEKTYCGWGKYWPTAQQFETLYSSPEFNVLDATTNEFCELFEGDQLKDILFWDGTRYQPLKYKDIKNPYTGETVRPRNLEQKMALHLLQNSQIKVKLLFASWGSGKTMLALNYALEQINKGAYSKLVFIRNNIIAANTNDIGFLPGSVTEKLSLYTRCIADHVGGEEALEQLIDDKIIEAVPLSHIRGRSIKNSIVLCDECENMDDKLVTLLMSRIEESSELIFCGDVAQIDKQVFVKNNGIQAMLSKLAGSPLFGAVKLIKSERGPVAQLCDLIRPPT